MAEKEYTVVAPDGKEITFVGPAGASQEEVIAQAQKLYKPTASAPVAKPQAVAPAPENRGNIINTDVPTVVGTQPNPPVPQEPKKTVADYAKALYEVPTTVVTGAAAPFLGAGKGIIQNIQQGTNKRVDRPELAQEFMYEPTSPVSQNILESAGGALEAAKLPPYIPATGQLAQATKQASKFAPLPSYSEFEQGLTKNLQGATNKLNTMASALRKEPVGEVTVGEIKPSPMEGVVQRYKEAFTPTEKPNYATAQQLEDVSQGLFAKAKESGVELNPKYFGNYMKSVQKDLRSEGYDPRTMPKVAVALEEMQNTSMTKDLDELKTLRKFIRNAQKSLDPEEKRVATILKGEFDDYVATVPDSSVNSGSKEGLAAWKEARDTYSKLSKAEIFDDMLEIAKLEKGKYSQAGIEQSLYNQLKNLAKNDKRMRMFTAEEQDAIRKAAEGTDLQNTLKFIGKFAPTSTVSSILPLLVTGASAPAGILGTTAAIGSRAAAAQMRKNQVAQLANLMRGTVNPEWENAVTPANSQLSKMLRLTQGEK